MNVTDLTYTPVPSLQETYRKSCEEVKEEHSFKTSIPGIAMMAFCGLSMEFSVDNSINVTDNSKWSDFYGNNEAATTILDCTIGGNKTIQLSTIELDRDYFIIDEEIQKRQQELQRLFSQNYPDITLSPMAYQVLEESNKKISTMRYNDVDLSYNSIDDFFQYDLYFNNAIEISLGINADISDKDVDFDIYQDDELIAANYMTLDQIVEAMNRINSKYNKNNA